MALLVRVVMAGMMMGMSQTTAWTHSLMMGKRMTGGWQCARLQVSQDERLNIFALGNAPECMQGLVTVTQGLCRC